MTTKKTAMVKVSILWYCAKCWQEDSTEIEVEEKDRFKVFDPAEVPEVRRKHAAMVRGFIGGAGKCKGILRPQEEVVRHRIKREVPPFIDLDIAEPIQQTAAK